MNYVAEKYKSIYDFQRTIDSRKNNEVMASEHASKNRGYDEFSQTSSYSEAVNLLKNGYEDNVDIIKKEFDTFKKSVQIKRNRQIKSVYGYAPIVANAIKGHPKSMLRTEKKDTVKKQRTYHFIFANIANCNVSGDDLMKSGMALLKLCYLLDSKGVKTKIDIMPFFAEKGSEYAGCLVEIKDYRQPFNIGKLSYPIAHTSFFRRQGFKWLETVPTLTERKFSYAYGHSVEGDEEKIEDFFAKLHIDIKEDNVCFVHYKDVKKADYDPYKLAESKGIILGK